LRGVVMAPADGVPGAQGRPAPTPSSVAPTSTAASNTKPSSVKPTSAKPTAVKPTTVKPATAKPDATKPATAKPDAAKPAAAKPGPAKPAAAKPGPAKPGIAKPAPVKPTAVKPTTSVAVKRPAPAEGDQRGPPLARHRGAQRDTRPAWMTKGLGIGTQMLGEATGELVKPGLTKTELEQIEARGPSHEPDPFADVFSESSGGREALRKLEG